MRTAIFRWKAIVPLVLFLVLLVGTWSLWGDRWLRAGIEAGGTAALGARVAVQRAHLGLSSGQLTLRGLIVASPNDSFQNLFQADELTADLAVLPLLEKKVVIDRLAATGLEFGTPRTTNGIVPSTGPSVVTQVRGNVGDWASRVNVPVLQLATGKVEIGQLDPAKLATPRLAAALSARADSTKQALATGLDSLQLGPTLDSAQALLVRLRGAKATDLAGINDTRKTLDRLKKASDRLTALERRAAAGAAALKSGAAGLDSARKDDEALARSLVKLPPLDAAAVGAALFGRQTVNKVQRTLYYAQLARAYMPPGLKPQAHPGPRRVRRPGTTVRFPRAHEDPGFLLKTGELSFRLAADSQAPRDYHGRLTGLTSDPALYGRPTTFAATAPGAGIGALLDHVRPVSHDTLSARMNGVRLAPLALPSLPIRLDPGKGATTVAFALTGDSLRARWGIYSSAVSWTRSDTAGSALGDLVWRALAGITTLDLEAEIRGSLTHPALAVHSNLDDALAARLKAVVGEQAAAAERRVRARVDSLVDAAAAPARARATAATADAQRRLADQRARLDQLRKDLDQRLRQLAGGLRLH